MEYTTQNDNNYLCHYGVKGQKWGIRRYQNEDGTLTPEGKDHYNFENIKKSVDEITSNWSDKDWNLFTGSNDKNDRYVIKDDMKSYADFYIKKYKNEPISFAGLYKKNKGSTKSFGVMIGTKEGKEYRGKGYASNAVKKIIDRNDDKKIFWWAREDNFASNSIAKKNDFNLVKQTKLDDGVWNYYKRNQNRKE